ncbi:hypothetical protein K461DRAFT_279568 [Myriangium duriaei CBS 260.36]|uniref:Integral membrane protein n=1 Tax=Myriangium duriaei CBS 260.36 TaxID=1168546 RepID=A0A9P4MJG6_9PEZI|nr:hypothetical protein K461DRAFT_279568 [Myriangium duriaei CBS 260.36]
MTSKAVVPLLVGMMLLTGVCNTLLTKYQDMQCVGNCTAPPARQKTFEQPVLQTLQMFVGEAACWLVVFASYLIRRFTKASSASDTAYQPLLAEDGRAETGAAGSSSHEDALDPTNIVAKPLADPDIAQKTGERIPLQGRKILLLALPACCDIAGTTLMNVGLLFVAASIYQMTRGALVLFVGLFSVLFLKRHLGFWKWMSLIIVVIGVALVGMAGYFERKNAKVPMEGESLVHAMKDVAVHVARNVVVMAKEHTAAETVVGVLLIAGAQIFTASQFVLEESIMEKYAMDPIKVVGWEGTFGFLVTLIAMGILHAVVGRTEAGQGGYFDARQGFYEMFHHRAIAVTSVLIMISIGGFNFFGLSVTRTLSATARSTIDTCRTLFIWLVSLGLGWETFKWLQVPGFALLVYGTALFNEIVRPPTISYLRRRIGSGN